MEPCGFDLHMLHKMSAYEVVVVTETLWRLFVVGQQDAGVLDGIAGEYKAARFYGVFFAFEVFYRNALDGCDRLVGIDVYKIGIGVEMDVLRFLYSIGVLAVQ